MTTPIARGKMSRLALGTQTDFLTPATTYIGANYYTHSLREAETPEIDPLIGFALNNDRDEAPAAPGLSAHGGDIDLPLCLNGIGDWLVRAFNPPVTSGSGTDKTHVFSSGTAQIPVSTVELKATGSDYRQHVGLVMTSLKGELADAAGYQRLMASFVGRQESLIGASAAGTPVSRALDQFARTGAAVYLGGTLVGTLLGFSFDYTTGAAVERYIDGDDKPGAAVLDQDATFSGSMRLRFSGPTFDQLAIAHTDSALEIRFVKSPTRSLIFGLPAFRIGRAGAVVTGPGGMEATHPFRAAQTTGAPLLTATLKNAIASYVA